MALQKIMGFVHEYATRTMNTESGLWILSKNSAHAIHLGG